MGKKFICEVKKDGNDNKLKLVDANDYDYSSQKEAGAIKFSTKNQMNSYFNEKCVSVDEIQNSSNNLFTFLFFLLLLIFIVTLVYQMMGKSKNIGTATSFGRFSF